MGTHGYLDEIDDEIGGGFRARRNGIWLVLIGVGLAGYGNEVDKTAALVGGILVAVLGFWMIGVHRIPAELRKARENRSRRAETLRQRVRDGKRKPRGASARAWKTAKAEVADESE